LVTSSADELNYLDGATSAIQTQLSGKQATITSGSIAHSDLVDIASGKILVGNSSGVPTAVAVSGDATLSNAGALSLTTDARHTRTINATAHTAAYTIASTDGIILADTSATAFTLTLPTASGIAGRTYTVKLATAGNPLTIAAADSETIDGQSGMELTNVGEAVSLISDGSNWRTQSDAQKVMLGGGGSGSWRIVVVGDNLEFQRNSGTSWDTMLTIQGPQGG